MLQPGKAFFIAVLGGFALVMMTACSHAAPAIELEIQRAEKSNRAWLRVVDTRLAYERERLSRLETLRKDGHASWLETARQAATVEALIEHQRAAGRFGKWLSDLRAQLLPDDKEAGMCLQISFAIAAPQANADDRNRLQLAKAAMEQAQREFDALQTPPEDGSDAAPSDALDPSREAGGRTRPTQLEILQLAFHPQLARATLRTAEAQTQSMAYEKMVGLLARKARLRFEAVKALHARGLATAVELESAQSTVVDAEDVHSTARSLARLRQAEWTNLRTHLAVYDTAQRKPSPPNNDVQAVAADPEAMRHFILLQLVHFQAEARRSESDIEARLLSELVSRLDRAGLDHESGRRERQMARLDLELAQARSDVASEQQVALQYQTQQLMAAVGAQQRQAKFNRLVASAATLVAPRLAVSYLQWPRSPLFSSFAIPPQPALIAWNVPGCFHWRDVGYWYGRRARVLPFSYGLWGFGRSAWWTRRYYAFGPYCGGFYHHGLVSRLGLRSCINPWVPTLSCRGLSMPRYRIHKSGLRSYLSAPTLHLR